MIGVNVKLAFKLTVRSLRLTLVGTAGCLICTCLAGANERTHDQSVKHVFQLVRSSITS